MNPSQRHITGLLHCLHSGPAAAFPTSWPKSVSPSLCSVCPRSWFDRIHQCNYRSVASPCAHLPMLWLPCQAGIDQKRSPAQAHICCQVLAGGSRLRAHSVELLISRDKQLHALEKCTFQAKKALVSKLMKAINLSCGLLNLQI